MKPKSMSKYYCAVTELKQTCNFILTDLTTEH